MDDKINENKSENIIKNKKPKNLDKEQFGHCKICNDKANGIHYGVASCEGCKGFYKRCITKKKLHYCNKDGDCIIKPDDRKKCKACRFRKCAAAGMNLDCKKMGRIPIKEKLKMKGFLASESPELKRDNIYNNEDEIISSNLNLDFSDKFTTAQIKNKSSIYSIHLENSFFENKVAQIDRCKHNSNDDSNENSNDSSNDSLSAYLGKDKNDNDMIKDLFDNKTNTKYDEIDDLIISIEKQLSIFVNKKQYSINLKDKDDYIKQNFDLDIFLKFQSKTDNKNHILSNDDIFFNMDNENMLYFLTVIRNKVHHEYIEFIKPLENMITIATDIINKRISLPHPSKEIGLELFEDFSKKQVPIYIEYAKQLPGLEDLCKHDFTTILDNNLSILFSFRFAKLFIQNENYAIIENYHLDKNTLFELFGDMFAEFIINFHIRLNELNLSDEEFSLLIPFVLTSIEVPLVNESFLKEINLYYSRALLYEFSLNYRDREFINQVAEVIELCLTIKKGFNKITAPKFS